jgi:hypothetical protein
MVELRHQLHSADLNARPDWDDFPYWNWYRDTVQAAIEIKKAQTPAPVPHPAGHIDVKSIKERANIVTVLESYGVQLKRAGKLLKACCPFHTEKTPSFIVYPDENLWHCFGCNIGGDVFDFVKKIDNIGFLEAAEKVGAL